MISFCVVISIVVFFCLQDNDRKKEKQGQARNQRLSIFGFALALDFPCRSKYLADKKHMKFFKNLFLRKPHGNPLPLGGGREGAAPLRIEGIPEAPFTAEPDDAELAAQALLELMAQQAQKTREGRKAAGSAPVGSPDGEMGAAYYRALASRIREAHAKAALQATRFIYNCELELQKPHLPLYGGGSVQMLETELYKRIDIIEREGGELKRRWQHCLAEVTVRLMNSTPQEEKSHTGNTEKKDGTQKAQKHTEGHS